MKHLVFKHCTVRKLNGRTLSQYNHRYAEALGDRTRSGYMLAIEKQLESTSHLCDDAMADVMILSKIDCAYNMFATERQLEVA